MDTGVYEKLRQHLDKHPSGAPESPEIIEILSELFTPDEARVASVTPFMPQTTASIAGKSGFGETEVKKRLESLADKGLVYSREKEGEWGYALLPIMPGIFEFPYMKVPKDEKMKRLSGLWERYLLNHAKSISDAGTPFARVIAIQEEVEDEPRVLTYEKVYELIDEAKVTGIAICACRNAFENCKAPLEACMLFDDTCTYLVERGYARYISKEEMKEKLREFDDIGLVHNVNNSQDKLQFICNCCPCCCGFLRSVIELEVPSFLASSGFLPLLEEDRCTGCAICEERCPVGAVEVVDELPVIDVKRCIGCGLCVTGCTSDALELVRREDAPATPASVKEMGLESLRRKGKLEEFLEVLR
jgi:Na+-translocating ferredoxin:NAD+ oxidoreductase subunit B